MMKLISKTQALAKLDDVNQKLREGIDRYEKRAKSCITCTTPGACCLDAHFVNVRISRLEAVRIRRALAELPSEIRKRVSDRIEDAIKVYDLDRDGEAVDKKFACPLFERGLGCLVHYTGKPVACVVHACYENASDLPPDALQEEAEAAIDLLNRRTYGTPQPLLPLPLAIRS